MANGEYHSLALDDASRVWSWGYNYSGQLGDGSTTNRNLARQVQDPNDPSGYLTSVADIATSGYTSFALKTNGTVVGWGDGSAGGFGSAPGTGTRLYPEAVQGLPPNIRTIWTEGDSVFGVTAGAQYADYQAAHFSAAEIAAGLADPVADYDGDGQSNFLEWILQTNPKQANPAAWQARREGDEFVFAVEYLNVAEGVTVTFQTSMDLRTWEPAQSASVQHTDQGDLRHTTLQFNLAPGQDRLFLRLKAHQP